MSISYIDSHSLRRKAPAGPAMAHWRRRRPPREPLGPNGSGCVRPDVVAVRPGEVVAVPWGKRPFFLRGVIGRHLGAAAGLRPGLRPPWSYHLCTTIATRLRLPLSVPQPSRFPREETSRYTPTLSLCSPTPSLSFFARPTRPRGVFAYINKTHDSSTTPYYLTLFFFFDNCENTSC